MRESWLKIWVTQTLLVIGPLINVRFIFLSPIIWQKMLFFTLMSCQSVGRLCASLLVKLDMSLT